MRRAGDILRVFLDRHTADQAELYNSFFLGWRKIVGDRIAAHSRVKDVQRGTVIIEVDHPGWIQMIQMKQTRFVAVLQREYPELNIRGLRIQLPWADRAAESRPKEEETRSITPNEPDLPPDGAVASKDEVSTATDELPADPRIRGALSRLGKAIEEHEQST